MTMTDPIADMLTRLRNANSAFHDTVSMPHSKLKSHIAEILQQQGYISGFQVTDTEGDLPGKVLTLDLKYGPNRERSIAGVRRVSCGACIAGPAPGIQRRAVRRRAVGAMEEADHEGRAREQQQART